MDEGIETLLFLQQAAEGKYKFKSKRVGIRVNFDYDGEMNLLARIATHHACDVVEEQYKSSTAVEYGIEASTFPSYETLVNPETKQNYEASSENNACSCVFHQTFAMPPYHLSSTQTVVILPEMLVKKCITAVENLKIREDANRQAISYTDVAVDILNVGLFLATDVKITSEWHSIAKLVGGARALITWVKSVELENPEDEEERSQILEDVKNMDMRGSINSGGQVLLFVKFTRFADQGWMSDGCMVTAANRIAAEASWNPPPKVYVANPTFAGFVLQEQHNRFVDTNNFIFSKCQDDMVIVFPIHVKVDIPRWCGAIFDIKRRSVWVYDPFHDKDYEAAAETILEKVYMPLISPAYQLEIRLYRAWRQRDGFSCGVYVAHWFDH
ncbi:hypothetical protein PC122_g22086 [Phytophthora cactorum]|nr:hypothetical protein PC122_g22086 [Phytophthora cactorum]